MYLEWWEVLGMVIFLVVPWLPVYWRLEKCLRRVSELEEYKWKRERADAILRDLEG